LKKAWVEALEDRVQGVKQRVEEAKQQLEAAAQRLSERRAPGAVGPSAAGESTSTAVRAPENAPLAESPELPVVARLIVEIRSDGSRTLARGALEDVVTGERVQLEANGGSPAQLAASLAGSLLATPFALGRYARAVVRQRLRRGDGER
jgi:sugar-specific transcriptional regulator TrmB